MEILLMLQMLPGNVNGQKEEDDPTNGWFIGHPISEIWQPKIIGVWQIGQEADAIKYGQYPGDFRLEDVNADGKINQLDNQFQGQTEPLARWYLREEFNIYKNFDVSFSVYSNMGHYGVYNVAKNRENFPERVNQYVTPYWTPENPLNDYARIYSNEGGAVFNVYRDRTFIRLDNFSMAYSLPSSICQKIKVLNLKIYGTVSNVAYWAPNWLFWDPEESGPNPRMRSVGFPVGQPGRAHSLSPNRLSRDAKGRARAGRRGGRVPRSRAHPGGGAFVDILCACCPPISLEALRSLSERSARRPSSSRSSGRKARCRGRHARGAASSPQRRHRQMVVPPGLRLLPTPLSLVVMKVHLSRIHEWGSTRGWFCRRPHPWPAPWLRG